MSQSHIIISKLIMEKVLTFVPLKVSLFCIILASLIASDVNNVPVSVTRRIGGDIYYVTSTSHFVCNNDNNVTFLVSENRCIKNEELLNGNHALIIIIIIILL